MWCQHRCGVSTGAYFIFIIFPLKIVMRLERVRFLHTLFFLITCIFHTCFYQEHALLHASFYLVHPSLDIWVYAHVIGETNIWEIQIIFSTMGLHGIFSARSLCDQSTCIYGTITTMGTILSWNWLPNPPDTKFYDWKIINSIMWWWFSLVS